MSELQLVSLQNFINYTIFNQNESNQMHPLDIDVTNPMLKELLHYHFWKKKNVCQADCHSLKILNFIITTFWRRRKNRHK